MIKKGCIALALCIVVLSICLVAASYKYESEDISTNYTGGEQIRGTIKISFAKESAQASIKSNFKGNISLIELIEANGYIEDMDYNCSWPGCGTRYISTAEVQNINLNGKEIVGLKISGGFVSGVSDAQLLINTSKGASCSPQLKVDFFDDKEEVMINNKPGSGLCTETKNYGCFKKESSSSDSDFIIGSNNYCERVKLPVAPAYKIGARVKNSTNGQGELQMTVLSLEGDNKGECILPKHTQSTQDLECAINYTLTTSEEHYICIRNTEYSEGIDGGEYYIATEQSSPVCGSDDEGSSENRDYEIFFRPLEFASGGVEINEDSYMNNFGTTLSSAIETYIEDQYGSDCTTECIIPISIEGTSQTVTFSKVKLSYSLGQSTPAPQNKVYRVNKQNANLTSNLLELDLIYANLTIPIDSEEDELEIYLGSKRIVSIPITITPGFEFDVYPKFAGIGINSLFQLKSVQNVASVRWSWGDDTEYTSNNTFASHRYISPGIYEMEVEVSKTDGSIGRKSFNIEAGDANVSAGLLISQLESRLNNITAQINSQPAWIIQVIKKGFDPADASAALTKIKADYSVSTNDEQYTEIVNSLLDIDMPLSIRATEKGILPLGLGYQGINIQPLKEISGVGEDELDEEKIIEDISTWSANNYNSQVEFEVISMVKESGETEGLATRYKVNLVPKGEITDNIYLIVGYPFNEIKFSSAYSEKTIGDSAYIPLSAGQQTVEFALPGKVTMDEIGLYISPEIRRLGEDYSDVGEIEPPSFSWKLFGILISILIAVTFVAYIFLQEWYKRNYERKLFPNKDDLYNLIHFIYNSRFGKLNDDEIKRKLSNMGWDGEQIRYAFNKLEGRRTGMWEIPLFKHTENKVVMQEINRREIQGGGARFIKRPNS